MRSLRSASTQNLMAPWSLKEICALKTPPFLPILPLCGVSAPRASSRGPVTGPSESAIMVSMNSPFSAFLSRYLTMTSASEISFFWPFLPTVHL